MEACPTTFRLRSGGVLQHNYGANWQPRVGLAYKLSDKTALRGGFGIFYDNFSGVLQAAQNLGHTWPDVGRRISSDFNTPTAQQPTPYDHRHESISVRRAAESDAFQ